MAATYDIPSQKVLDALVLAGTMDNVLLDPAPSAVISSYGDGLVNYSLRVWVKTEDYWDVHHGINRRIFDLFRQNNIEMTYPHLNVHLDK